MQSFVLLQTSHNIDLCNTEIMEEGIIYLTELPNLRGLFLSRTDITAKSLKYFCMMSNLQNLDISYCNITHALSLLAPLNRLTHLTISSDQEDGRGKLCPLSLQQLKIISVDDTCDVKNICEMFGMISRSSGFIPYYYTDILIRNY